MMIRPLAFAIASALLSSTALAQEPAPTEPAQPQAPDQEPQAQTPSSPADASQPAAATNGRRGLVLVLRPLAPGFPMGDLEKNSKLSDLTVAQVAFWLDVGYMVTSQLMLGIYAQYAIAGGGHEFTGSGSDIRLGVQAQYHPIEVGLLNPWVGLGIGYEMLSTSATFANVTVSAKGFEFANLQAGLDFRLGRFFGLGPFVGYSIGQYSSVDSDTYASGGQSSGKALHEWLMVGAQFSLTL